MNETQDKMNRSLCSPEQAINAAKWDKRSPWTVLVKILRGTKPSKESGTTNKDRPQKSKK
jgi:hypothetical protein